MFFLKPVELITFSYQLFDQIPSASLLPLGQLSIFSSYGILIFSQSLVSPIKKLSKLTILERERVDENKIVYPNRKDEIGALSKEIQNMSAGLKLQIQQLEKFSADVSHELKNPLTSLQSAIELIGTNNLPENKKDLLIKNIHNDLKRMNQLITDISNFTRLKAEIELKTLIHIN